MAKLTPEKRKKMEKLIYDTFSALDPTKANTEKYQQMFSKMSNVQFDEFFKKLFSSEDNYLILDIADYERNLDMDKVNAAANLLKIPLYEKINMPYLDNNKENPIQSMYEVPVGYLHIKRMQQMLNKKNSSSTETTSRNMLTGQVTAHDKNARSSDMENFNLVVLDGSKPLMQELMGPRGDDMVMMNEMLQQIAVNGYASLDKMTNKLENKTALNTIDVFFMGVGLKTDLVTKGLVLNSTLNEK